MKKIVAISLSIFVIAVGAVFVFGLGSQEQATVESEIPVVDNEQVETTSGQPVEEPVAPIAPVVPPAPVVPVAPTSSGFSSSEVAKHNKLSDCWFIIGGKVYDITEYIKSYSHPGDNETMTPYCGKEATNAFETKDKSKPKDHSGEAYDALGDYYVGDLAQ